MKDHDCAHFQILDLLRSLRLLRSKRRYNSFLPMVWCLSLPSTAQNTTDCPTRSKRPIYFLNLCNKSLAKLVLGLLPSSILTPAVASIPKTLSLRSASLATATLPLRWLAVAAPPPAAWMLPRRPPCCACSAATLAVAWAASAAVWSWAWEARRSSSWAREAAEWRR